MSLDDGVPEEEPQQATQPPPHKHGQPPSSSPIGDETTTGTPLSVDTVAPPPPVVATPACTAAAAAPTITTLIFDVDDTLYDVGTGFTSHRNNHGAQSFMVERLNFPDFTSAKKVRDEYFRRYHSTAKGLTVAQAEGRLPPDAPRFDPKDLAEHWANNLDYSLLRGPAGGDDEYAELRSMLRSCPLNLVAFSNGPRKYVLRVLREMGLDEVFPDDAVFAVDDVLPHCKPEPEAFRSVLDQIGGGVTVRPEQCVMVEDSMKNVRVAGGMGMRTVLVVGRGRGPKTASSEGGAADEAERTKAGDAPDVNDPAVDVWVEHCGELREALPGLWETPASFDRGRSSSHSALSN